MSRPIPGALSVEYVVDNARCQRCSRCHRERVARESEPAAPVRPPNPEHVARILADPDCAAPTRTEAEQTWFSACDDVHRAARTAATRTVGPLRHVRPSGSAVDTLLPITIGFELVGMVCSGCVLAIERQIQASFPDGLAFPFVNMAGHRMPTPRCECGTVLAFTADGRGMTCTQCDVQPVEPFAPD